MEYVICRVLGHYFIYKLLSLFTHNITYDDRQLCVRRYSSLPWVGVHALKFQCIPGNITFLLIVCEDTLEMLPSGAQTRVTRRVLHARVLYVKRADRKWLATVVRCNMRLFFLIDSVVAVSWYLFWSFLPALLTSEVFQPNIVEEIKTHILCSVTFSQKSCLLWDNVEIYCRAGQTKDDNMTHAHCMLGT